MRRARVPLALGLALAACGEVGSLDDARDGWSRTKTAIGDGTTRIRDEGLASPVDVTFECAEGGTIAFDGTYERDPVAGDLRWSRYTIVFTRCVVDDLRIDGELVATFDVDLDDQGNVIGATHHYQGELQWRGAVRGRCPLDFSQDFSSGGGDFCGYDGFDAFPGV